MDSLGLRTQSRGFDRGGTHTQTVRTLASLGVGDFRDHSLATDYREQMKILKNRVHMQPTSHLGT